MGPLAYLRSVYDVSTLDSRFTTPSSIPHRAALEARDSPAKDHAATVKATAAPSRWKSPEYIAYGLFLVWAIPGMFVIGYSVSRPSDPRYSKYEQVLSPGWIPGRKVDVTDAQYRTFRTNLPYMAALLIFHPLARRLYNAVFPVQSTRGEDKGAARLSQRASFDFAFALLFLVALHGFSAIKVLLILYANFRLGTILPRKYVPLATWVFNIGILFANDVCNGYQFRSVASLISPPTPGLAAGSPREPLLVRWGSWLDSYSGILSRWEIMFNITILRLISFNMDRHWAADSGQTSALEKKQLDPANLSERDRVAIPADLQDYSFRNYVGYALYAPLYIAGPIFSFNDYIAQSKHRSATIATPLTLRYAARLLLALLAMELILHHIYVGAIASTAPNWTSYTASQLCLLSYFNLHIIWLKLLLPWRLFRLWSLADGIDPPENMVRCVSDNFSTLHFWRAWHRSYNKWLIRYLYVPLGGARFDSAPAAVRGVVTYVLVFTFVALWHDIKMHLLIWGWLVVLFLLPEIVAKRLFPASRWRNYPTAYRMLCGVGALVNVFSMMSANLVGFAVGVDGMKSIIRGIFKDDGGLAFLALASLTTFFGVQIMFEVRESEKRKGLLMKC